MKKITIISLAVMLSTISLFAQTNDMKYRRSSLTMVLLEGSKSFPNKEAVMKSWKNYPFPDKYNKHEIDLKYLNLEDVKLSDEDLRAAGFLDTLDNPIKIAKAENLGKLRYLNDDHTLALRLPTDRQRYQIIIDKINDEKQIAKQMVASWFHRSTEGKFDMSLIQERGFYNASELDAAVASGGARGLSALGDAGEELIGKTFIIFTKLEFYENEPVARAIRDAAKAEAMKKLAGKPQIVIDKSMKAIDAAYDKAKEGYSLWSKTWLYKLNWNDSIANVFYSELWNNPEAFDKTDLFSLKFIGVQYNQSLVTMSLKKGEGQRSEEEIIDLALVRNLDNAFAKLQKKNDVFKALTPVTSVNPLTAKIGLKESIGKKTKFEVLEMVWDKKEGKTTWKVVGKCSVDKKYPIWDNRYYAGETHEQKDEKGNVINATHLKGSKKIQVGMLLKELK